MILSDLPMYKVTPTTLESASRFLSTACYILDKLIFSNTI